MTSSRADWGPRPSTRKSSKQPRVRALPVVVLPGVRRVYVRREDVIDYLTAHTNADGEVRP